MNQARTVLLVDDDDADRAVIRRLLREADSTIRLLEAATGTDGLRLALEEKPDCILLDYHLPDLKGLEFVEKLNAGSHSQVPPLPIALLTGTEDGALAARALERGVQDYVIKGTVNGAGLIRVIENAREKHRLRKQLEHKQAALELRNFELEMLRDELQGNLRELVEATKAKDQFVAVMSHEMRTPLNAILGYAELMEMGIGGSIPEAQHAHLARIRVGSQHLLDLINDVLDLARADARRLNIDVRPVDLLAVLEEVIGLLESQAQIKNVKLAIDVAEPLPMVLADLQRLRQIITNLVGNAIKFTEKGSVTVRCRTAASGVIVEVIDTGVGIPTEKLPLIFEEFYQADGSLTRARGGSGLGLAISQRLAQLMGGEITASSTAGQGSTFTLLLRTAPNASAQALPELPEPADKRHSREAQLPEAVNVLAYGHDARVLADLAEHVKSHARLIWTTDAAEVPELTRTIQPSLVVIDISRSGGEAWRAAQSIQELPELAQTAVLLLPGIPPHRDDDTPGLDLGWVALVPKPFTAEQLTSAVHQARGSRTATGPEDSARVLIVDDDADSRRVAAEFLASAGATIQEADGGEAALALMRKRPPDVLVLDLMMPVLDGFGVLAAMRLDPLLAAIPVVVLSAKTLTEAERQFLARAAVRVLQKGEHRLADVAALVLRAAGKPATRKLM